MLAAERCGRQTCPCLLCCRWSSTSWFSSGAGAVALQEAAALPSVAGRADGNDRNAAEQGVGGAVTQSRFMGRTAIPIATTPPVDGAPTISFAAPAPTAAQQQQQQQAAWPGRAQTCDGSGAAAEADAREGSPGAFQSRWVFDVNAWQWQQKHQGDEGGDEPALPSPAPAATHHRLAQHDIAARRWGDGRDTLGAALASQQGQQQQHQLDGQGAAKRQRVVVAAARGGSAAIGWASLGGLARQKEQLSAAVLLPLRHPALFRALGVDAVRGVLLHGPPGSGKSALARALGEEAGPGVHYEALSGAEAAGGDEAAARLKRAFATGGRAGGGAPACLAFAALRCPGFWHGAAAALALWVNHSTPCSGPLACQATCAPAPLCSPPALAPLQPGPRRPPYCSLMRWTRWHRRGRAPGCSPPRPSARPPPSCSRSSTSCGAARRRWAGGRAGGRAGGWLGGRASAEWPPCWARRWV